MCTHNQCFRTKKEKNITFFHLEINIFYSREILLYIAWACLRNEKRRIMGTEDTFKAEYIYKYSLVKFNGFSEQS